MPRAGSGESALLGSLRAAHAGCEQSLAELCEHFRAYLMLVARRQVNARLQRKVGRSDLVQDAILTAQRRFDQFRGQSIGELRAWLRSILVHRAMDAIRLLRTRGAGDVSLQPGFDERAIVRAGSGAAVREQPLESLLAAEKCEQLAEALSQLPASYRQVIRLRTLERRPFAEIAILMNRSPDAARKLWTRAIEHLRQMLAPRPNDTAH